MVALTLQISKQAQNDEMVHVTHVTQWKPEYENSLRMPESKFTEFLSHLSEAYKKVKFIKW